MDGELQILVLHYYIPKGRADLDGVRLEGGGCWVKSILQLLTEPLVNYLLSIFLILG